MKNILEVAKGYVARGFSVIPLEPKGKRPALKSWKEFQERRPTNQELETWFGNSQHNIGIVTGKISGIAVIDCDSEDAVKFAAENNFLITPIVKTGKEYGYHRYYAYPKGKDVGNFQKRDDLPGIDFRGEGGYVVAPPSIHSSGKQYEWLPSAGPDEISLAELPEIILASKDNKTPLKELYKGVSEGSRNDSMARIVGSLVKDDLSLEECLQVACSVNEKNVPPLRVKEVIEVVDSIYNKHQNQLSGSLGIYNDGRDSRNFDPLSFLKTGAELMKMENIKVEWLINKLLPKDAITVLHGKGGIDKSLVALKMANAISQGLPFMGLETEKTSVTYVDFENSTPVLVERARTINSPDVLFWHSICEVPPISLDAKEWENYKKLPLGVLIIDTLRMSQSGDENDSTEMARTMRKLKALRDMGFTIILIHHTRDQRR